MRNTLNIYRKLLFKYIKRALNWSVQGYGIRIISLRKILKGIFWWGGLTAAVSLARKKKRKNSFQRVNRMFGVVLNLFGVLVFIRAFPI